MLRFVQQKHGKAPTDFHRTDLNAKFLLGFLDHLEQQRQNPVRSRNVRLAAVRSFLKFAAGHDPAHLSIIEQALAVPMKRFHHRMAGFVPRNKCWP